MSTPDIPLVDISRWRTGDPAERDLLARRLDRAMQDSGFFMVSGHGIDPTLLADLRASARSFFALPGETKQKYRCAVGGRGWIARGDEANAYVGEAADPTKADMKESLTIGREHRTGDPDVDAAWFQPNVWPEEVPTLAPLADRFAAEARALYDDLVRMLAVAIGLPETYFLDRVQDSPHTFNINRYPALGEVGPAAQGQFRVAPHTDWGMLTILDRQPGYGGLQVQGPDGDWADAPFVEGALTINIADMLARWTGDRWRSTRHRVLPPSADAPSEELISLIVFMESDMTETISPLEPPIGGGAAYEPVLAADYFTQRALAATVA